MHVYVYIDADPFSQEDFCFAHFHFQDIFAPAAITKTNFLICSRNKMAEILLIKTGIELFRSKSTVDKVNNTIASLRVYDTDGNLELDESEIKHAIETLKSAILKCSDKKVSAKLAELRCLLVFIGASQRMWQKDPRHYNALFSQSMPKIFGLLPFATWDRNPKVAKLEKIVCTFYKAGGARKLLHKIEEAVKEEVNGALQEELFGSTFEGIAEEILSETFGDIGAEILMAFI